MRNKLSLNFWDSKKPNFRRRIMQNVIIDRKSKYTVVGWYVEWVDEVKPFIKELLKDKYFQKSTHNTYAYRIELGNGSIIEWKNDDGEVWAWNCILRELQRDNSINTLVIVTRYFWWIHLQSDRFKNVIDATKIILREF